MNQIVEHCPLCGDSRSSHFDQRVFRGREVFNRLCENCGLVYQSPRMTDEELESFYESEYRQVYQGEEGPIARELAVQRARAEALLGFVQKEIPSVSRHLDIGSSAGLLLQFFNKHYQTEAFGIEPGQAYREYAQSQGLAVYSSLEELQKTSPATFDLVSMTHILEHLPYPVEYLSMQRDTLLDADGYLLLEVPNLYGHDCFEIAHMISFSAHTLTETVRKAGFMIVRLEKHGRPRSELVPYYITALARPVASPPPPKRVRAEKQVRLKRKLGLFRRRVANRLLPRKAWINISG